MGTSLKLDSTQSITLRTLDFSHVLFTLNIWVAFDPSGMITSYFTFLQAFDFYFRVYQDRSVEVKENTVAMLDSAEGVTLDSG